MPRRRHPPIEAEKLVGALDPGVSEGQETVVSKTVILHSDRNPQQPLEDRLGAGDGAVTSHDKLLCRDAISKTGLYWDDFWAKSDITIDGDADTQQGIRFCIFQMQQTYRGVIDGREHRRQRADRRGL